MPRRALMLSVALVGLFGSASASAAQRKLTVRGDVVAMALAGDAVIVARRPENADVRVERRVAGRPAQMLLRLPGTRQEGEDRGEGEGADVSIAASPQALVVSVQRFDEFGASHVYVGPPAGPLREVAACEAGLLLAPVAVSGSRVAWSSGGCGEPAMKPVSGTEATIVIGDADPAAPVRLIPMGTETLPTALVLSGPTGVVGLARPSFVTFKSEVRRIGAGGLGETITTQPDAIVVPVGILPNGATVHTLATHEGEDEDDGDAPCAASLFAIAPHSTQRRALPFSGCPVDQGNFFAAGDARVGGDRVYARVFDTSARSDDDDAPPQSLSLRSVRGDGSAGRLVVRGTWRTPRAFATDGAGRVGWSQSSCTGGDEIVLDDDAVRAAPTATPACNLRVLTRTARVRGRVITVRLRCRLGCVGRLTTRLRFIRGFTLKPGTHRIRLRLTGRERRAKRLRLEFDVDDGPRQTKTIRLR